MTTRVKEFILRQVSDRKLGKPEAFDLLQELLEVERAPAPAPQGAEAPRRDVAVVGMACRFSGADTPEQFWKNLAQGVDGVRPFPQHRLWDVIRVRRQLYEQWRGTVEQAEREGGFAGGFLESIDGFDAGFFDVPPAEARILGPVDRLFLEVAWEALEDAGLTRRELVGSRTGIYLGHSPDEPFAYGELLSQDDARVTVLNNPAMTGYRLSHWLDLKGPTLVINTSCSSSLVACHLACQGLAQGDCDIAMVGGLQITLFPYWKVPDYGVGSADGRCKAFDAAADGIAFGEGVGMLILKPLEKARADGDFIYSVIRGTATNSDARSNGLTAPNPAAQTDVILRAWERSGIDPATVSYVEAHGAGTQLGDPIEVKGLTDAFRRFTDRRNFCALGSVKTNLSHLGDAAGVAGLMKVALSLVHKSLPPSLHFKRPNPYIDFASSPVYVNDRLSPWEPEEGVRRAGISSFGISGTNCHVVMEEYVPEQRPSAASGGVRPFVVSARSEGALWRMLGRYESFLTGAQGLSFEDVCHTAARYREHHCHRAVILASSLEELRSKVSRLFGRRQFEGLPEGFASEGIFVSGGPRPSPGKPGVEQALMAAVGTYLAGGEVDWDRVFDGRTPRKVPLPAYAFDNRRFWPEHEVPAAEQYDAFLHDVRWMQWECAKGPSVLTSGGAFLLLGQEDALTRGLTERLRQAGQQVVVVHEGEGFAERGPGEWTVNPASTEDFARLAGRLGAEVLGRLAGVVHLWTCRPPDASMESLEGVDRAQDLGVMGLFRLVRALHPHMGERGYQLDVVSAYTDAVDSSEPALVPARVTSFGLARVLSQESPMIGCFCFDADVALMAPEALVEALFAEFCLERRLRDERVAFRGGKRFVQILDRMQAPREPLPAKPSIRAGGVYVLAGGTGYLGIQVGQYLARQERVKLVMLSRGGMPEKERWGELLRTAEPGSTLRYQLQGLLEMERLGAEVVCLRVDVTQPEQVKAAVAETLRRFGRIDGVFVAQKQLAHKPIQQVPEAEFTEGIMNRVRGTWLLDHFTREQPLEHFILFSSISSLMGTKTAAECCAVNQYLDVYGPWRLKSGRPAQVLNLTLIVDDLEVFKGPSPIPPLDFSEFLGCFERFLARRLSFAVVARFDLAEVRYLLPVIKLRFSEEMMRDIERAGGPQQARPMLAPPPEHPAVPVKAPVLPATALVQAPAVAPPVPPAPVASGSTLATLSAIWKDLLGHEELPLEQSFFSVGGTSLTVLRLVQMVRKQLGVKFEVADVYAHSTLAEMADHLQSLVRPPAAAADPLDDLLGRLERGDVSIDSAATAIRKQVGTPA